MVSTKLMMAHDYLSARQIEEISDDTVRPLLRAAYAVLSQTNLRLTIPVELFGEQGRYATASMFRLAVFLPEQVGLYFQGRKKTRGDVTEPTYTKGNRSSPLDDRLFDELARELHGSPWNTTAQCLFVREIVGEAWQMGAIGYRGEDDYRNYSYIHVPNDSPMGLAQILRSHTQQ